MTTLDKTALQAAYTALGYVTPMVDAVVTAYLDALSSLPAQAVGVKPAAWQCEFFHAAPSPRWHPEAWLSDPREIYGDTLVRNVKPLYLAPSQPAAVAITDEMVEAADYLIERLYNISKGIPVRDLDEALAAYRSARAALRSTP